MVLHPLRSSYYWLNLQPLHCVKIVRIRSSGPYFPSFLVRIISPYLVRMRKNMDQKNSEYGLFSLSFVLCVMWGTPLTITASDKIYYLMQTLYSNLSLLFKLFFFSSYLMPTQHPPCPIHCTPVISKLVLAILIAALNN